MMRLPMFLAFVLVGCGQASIALTEPDAATADASERYCVAPGRRIPVGMVFSDGCNQCSCESGERGGRCDGSICEAQCTAAACFCSGSDAGTSGCPPRECTAQGTCGGRQPCLFDPGCDSPSGFCVQTQPGCGYGDEPNTPADLSSPNAADSFCGCDGVTYSGSCAKVPYRHAGPCT